MLELIANCFKFNILLLAKRSTCLVTSAFNAVDLSAPLRFLFLTILSAASSAFFKLVSKPGSLFFIAVRNQLTALSSNKGLNLKFLLLKAENLLVE